MKRLSVLLLVLVTVISAIPVSVGSASINDYTADDGVIVFDSQEKVDTYIVASTGSSASNNVNYSFDAAEKALKVVVTGADPYIYINWYNTVTKKFNANSVNFIHTSYKAPTSNSTTAKNSTTCFYLCSGSYAVPSASYYANKSFKPQFTNGYTISSLNVGTFMDQHTGRFYGFRYDFFQNAQVGDVIYINSIVIDKDGQTFSALELCGKSATEKNGYPVDPSTDLLCTAYDAVKYTSPFWKGNIVYNEAVCPIQNDDGTYTYTLMYAPDEVISVYNGTLTVPFKEGKDFTVSGNKLTIIPSGDIMTYTQSAVGMYPDNKIVNELFFEGYLNITYTHSDTWKYYTPENKADKLPNTSNAIKNNEAYNVVLFGDSLAGAANVSSYRGYYPNTPFWFDMMADNLKASYGFSNINTYAISEGGSTASGMKSAFDSQVLPKNPDLVVIQFGVNDAQNKDVGEFKSALQYMINRAKAANPECEILLVSPFYSNKILFDTSYFDTCQKYIHELEDENSGVASVDVTEICKTLMVDKRHFDITGDNICHPNDYMSRIYAQAALEAIIPAELGYEGYVPAPEFTVEIGDINGDDGINMRDDFEMKLIIKNIVTPTEEARYAADVNGDGFVNILDSYELVYRIKMGSWRK